MLLYCAILLVLLCGGVASLFLGKKEAALKAASYALTAACIIGLPTAIFHLCTGAEAQITVNLLPLPLGHCIIALNPLSSFFLVPVFLLCLISALLMPERMRRLQISTGQPLHLGRHGCACCILAIGMILVLLAADTVLFVLSWEIMSLAPFFLINPADSFPSLREAPGNAPDTARRSWSPAWIYMVAAHLGAMPLLYLFAGMSVEAGGTSFVALEAMQGAWTQAGLFFVLALVGFGVKIGLVPLHGWMPRTYATAPAHVAIVLAGAMFNLGIYGILRVCSLLGTLPDWSGYVLMAVGAFSGIAAILLALMQKEIRRVLAYSSSENAGIICLGLGAYFACADTFAKYGSFSALLLFGVFFHIWNHSLYKSLLLLSSCAAEEGTGTGLIRLLGGLQKRIPLTGFCFAFGAAAIAGIPPLNGFMSELLLYRGFVEASMFSPLGETTSLVYWGAIFTLGTISGLSVFAFTRVFGLAFLGAPRSVEVSAAKEPERLYTSSMLLLAGLCACTCLAAPFLAPTIGHVIGNLLHLPPEISDLFAYALPFLDSAKQTEISLLPTGLDGIPAFVTLLPELLFGYASAGLGLGLLAAFMFRLRRRIVAANGSASGPTWDCGYAYPSPRIQYTDASFTRNIGNLLRPLIRTVFSIPKITDLFPSGASAAMHTPDWSLKFWKRGLFLPAAFVAKKIKGLQAGLVNVYVLYIFIALMVGLVWALG